jgi:hypothetical protein
MKSGMEILGIDRCVTRRDFSHRNRCVEIIDLFHITATIARYARYIEPPFTLAHAARHGAC